MPTRKALLSLGKEKENKSCSFSFYLLFIHLQVLWHCYFIYFFVSPVYVSKCRLQYRRFLWTAVSQTRRKHPPPPQLVGEELVGLLLRPMNLLPLPPRDSSVGKKWPSTTRWTTFGSFTRMLCTTLQVCCTVFSYLSTLYSFGLLLCVLWTEIEREEPREKGDSSSTLGRMMCGE